MREIRSEFDTENQLLAGLEEAAPPPIEATTTIEAIVPMEAVRTRAQKNDKRPNLSGDEEGI